MARMYFHIYLRARSFTHFHWYQNILFNSKNSTQDKFLADLNPPLSITRTSVTHESVPYLHLSYSSNVFYLFIYFLFSSIVQVSFATYKLDYKKGLSFSSPSTILTSQWPLPDKTYLLHRSVQWRCDILCAVCCLICYHDALVVFCLSHSRIFPVPRMLAIAWHSFFTGCGMRLMIDRGLTCLTPIQPTKRTRERVSTRSESIKFTFSDCINSWFLHACCNKIFVKEY
jgi:hypothetical protein